MLSFRFFKIEDFDCPCCGKNWVDINLIKDLEKVREELEQPIKILSGYRCEKHNKEVGGLRGSQHVLGLAADIHAENMDKLYKICCERFKAVGDGRTRGFLHVDRRNDRLHRWTYPA